MNPASLIAAQSKKFHPKFKFNADEDARLKELVTIYGENNWSQVAQNMPNRNIRQCKERWFNYLSPKICNNPWTQTEDSLLIEKFHEFGTRWVQIAKFFPNRTDINVKNRYLVLSRKFKKKLQINKNPDVSSKSSNYSIHTFAPQVITDQNYIQTSQSCAISVTPQPSQTVNTPNSSPYTGLTDSQFAMNNIKLPANKPLNVKFPPIEHLGETHFPPFSVLSPMNSIKLIHSQSIVS